VQEILELSREHDIIASS